MNQRKLNTNFTVPVISTVDVVLQSILTVETSFDAVEQLLKL